MCVGAEHVGAGEEVGVCGGVVVGGAVEDDSGVGGVGQVGCFQRGGEGLLELDDDGVGPADEFGGGEYVAFGEQYVRSR